jgi:hypothetical protein
MEIRAGKMKQKARSCLRNPPAYASIHAVLDYLIRAGVSMWWRTLSETLGPARTSLRYLPITPFRGAP